MLHCPIQVGVAQWSLAQQRSHFALWALVKAPLLIGANLQALQGDSLAVLKAKEVGDGVGQCGRVGLGPLGCVDSPRRRITRPAWRSRMCESLEHISAMPPGCLCLVCPVCCS